MAHDADCCFVLSTAGVKSYLCDMTYCFSVMGSCRVGLRDSLLPSAALPAPADAWLRLLHWRASQ
jgi:hypothetical protein